MGLDRDQRGVRQAAYLLSLLSAGLGLVWALVDEENLTWHDHISKNVSDARLGAIPASAPCARMVA